MNPARTLVYRFYELPYVFRMSISRDLELITVEDVGHDADLWKLMFERAKDRDLLAELWDLVEEKHDDQKHTPNPFKGLKGID